MTDQIILRRLTVQSAFISFQHALFNNTRAGILLLAKQFSTLSLQASHYVWFLIRYFGCDIWLTSEPSVQSRRGLVTMSWFLSNLYFQKMLNLFHSFKVIDIFRIGPILTKSSFSWHDHKSAHQTSGNPIIYSDFLHIHSYEKS